MLHVGEKGDGEGVMRGDEGEGRISRKLVVSNKEDQVTKSSAQSQSQLCLKFQFNKFPSCSMSFSAEEALSLFGIYADRRTIFAALRSSSQVSRRGL